MLWYWLCTLACASAQLTLSVYNNSAMWGNATTVSQLISLEFSMPLDRAFSAEVKGTLTFDTSGYYAFTCSFTNTQMAFVWVKDHLLCHTDGMFMNTQSSTDGSPQYPLRQKEADVSPIVVHIYNNATSTGVAQLSIKWSKLKAPVPWGGPVSWESIPSTLFSPDLPALEEQRRELQNSLKTGWNAWSYNLLAVARLPDSCSFDVGLCQISTQRCIFDTFIEDEKNRIRVGMHAVDSSFWQYYLELGGVNVSMSFSGGVGLSQLSVLGEPVNCGLVNCSDYALVLLPRYLWFRAGQLAVDVKGYLTFEPLGRPRIAIGATRPQDDDIPLPANVTSGPYFALLLNKGSVGLQEYTSGAPGPLPQLADIEQVIQIAGQRELDLHQTRFGNWSDVSIAVQSASIWNMVYIPLLYGPYLPISRQWTFTVNPVNSDWKMMMADWDNCFAGYLSSMFSKEVAYSNFIQVIRSKTGRGFIPNYEAAGSKSVDRSEPYIGSTVLLKLYEKFEDKWIVELLFDDLMDWNDWIVRERMFGPLGIVSLGSAHIDGYTDYSASSMQGARFESGMDNSPMYDGEFFVNISSTQEGSYVIGQMELYDLGMACTFVSESESLAGLARIIGRDAEAQVLQTRADTQRELLTKLWDPEGGMYTNMFWNGSFYRRYSPTSFYTLLAGVASDEQAAAMVENWLFSPAHFCIAPDGDFANNTDDCFWGLPSIEASDPAFPALGYWRGYVWAPTAQLTYWGMQKYDHVPVVRQGRKALCKQMTALMMSQWNMNRHICENFSPHKSSKDCTGMRFYHWGGLNGLISLVEAGFY